MCGCGCYLALIVATDAAATSVRPQTPKRVPGVKSQIKWAAITTLPARWLKRAATVGFNDGASGRIVR
jgi:hypothetical protein